MENKVNIAVWHDDFNRNSWKLCQKEYGIKILQAVPLDDDEVELVVYGPKENVSRFLEDVDDGTCEPMQTLSRQAGDDDEAYIAKLNELIDEFDACAEFDLDYEACSDEDDLIDLFGEHKNKEA